MGLSVHRQRLGVAPASPCPRKPLLNRQLESRQDTATIQAICFVEYTKIVRTGVDVHCALFWVDIPDEPNAGSEVLLQLALHLRRGVP